MVIDFGDVKEAVGLLDHTNINDHVEFPTAENIAKFLYDSLNKVVKEFNPAARVVSVQVDESLGSEIRYIKEPNIVVKNG